MRLRIVQLPVAVTAQGRAKRLLAIYEFGDMLAEVGVADAGA
jgi:hypothetical protein